MVLRRNSSLDHLDGTVSMGSACRTADVAASTGRPGDVATAARVGRLVRTTAIDGAARMDAGDSTHCVVASDGIIGYGDARPA